MRIYLMFKIGDKVKIKSFESICQTLESGGAYLKQNGIEEMVDLNINFNNSMTRYCGQTYKIIEADHEGTDDISYLLDCADGWSWNPQWLDKVNALPEDLFTL
jgi:hypothetical protein